MPLPKGFVSGTLTCSCGAKIKTQRPATTTKHPCQCPKCFTILGLSTEQLGTVVKCSQCNVEFRAGTGKPDNAFQDLGKIPPNGTAKTFIPPPTPPRTPTQQTPSHPLLETALAEEQAREQRETDYEKADSSTFSILGIFVIAGLLLALIAGVYGLHLYADPSARRELMNGDIIRKAESEAKYSLNTPSSYRRNSIMVYEDDNPNIINVSIHFSGTNAYGGRKDLTIYCEFNIHTRKLLRTVGPI